MTKDEFIETAAELVAGLQAPVSLMPRAAFGAAFTPWQKLVGEATGGFGWTDKEALRAAFAMILGPPPLLHDQMVHTHTHLHTGPAHGGIEHEHEHRHYKEERP